MSDEVEGDDWTPEKEKKHDPARFLELGEKLLKKAEEEQARQARREAAPGYATPFRIARVAEPENIFITSQKIKNGYLVSTSPYPGSQGEIEYCAGPDDVRKAVQTLLEAFLAPKGPPDIPAGT